MSLFFSLCSGCGACISACSKQNLAMEFNEAEGVWHSVKLSNAKCASCTSPACLAVCPNKNSNDLSCKEHKNSGLGNIENIYCGFSKDLNLRISASSGGVVRSIATELLRNRQIDGILSIMHQSGFDYFPTIHQDPLSMPNSIYHNVTFLGALKQLENFNGKVLVIGLPCQIKGLKLLLEKKLEGRVKEKTILWIALICGHSFSRNNFLALESICGFKMSGISYRNGGRDRIFRVFGTDGKSKLIHGKAFQNIRQFLTVNMIFDPDFALSACLCCTDHLGYTSDISVGDAWLKRFKNDKFGTNIIIVRTKIGDKILKNLKSVHVTPSIGVADIYESQGEYFNPELGLSWRYTLGLGYDYSVYSSFKKAISRKRIVKSIVVRKLFKKRKFELALAVYTMLEFPNIFVKLFKNILSGRKYLSNQEP